MKSLPVNLRASGRVAGLLTAIIALAGALPAQTCLFSSAANTVHAEGLAEPLADLTASCTGGTAGATVSMTIFVSLNASITNRLNANGDAIGIALTGATVGSLRLSSPSDLTFAAVNYTVPVVPATPVTLTISGIRAAIAPLGVKPSVVASIAGVGATFNSGTKFTLAVGLPSLLSSVILNGVPCNGSALPTVQDFAGFAATTNSSTVRVTEASPTAFTVRKAGDDSGTRIIVRLTGYGAGARIFVPDAIVGNSGSVPTSGGAFSQSAAAGTYTPGSSQLLLARVSAADANGAGSSPDFGLPAGGAITFSTMSEVTLTNGAAQVVYEVLDSGAAVQESAHIPVFVVVPSTNCPSALSQSIAAVYGPVSTVVKATATDPIPRFIATTPDSDCSQLSDCNAPYYPKLSVDQTPVILTGTSLGDKKAASVLVGNTGSGIVAFTTSVAYGSGAGWLTVSPPSGANSVTLQLIADASTLAEGTYTATVTVSAGVYGSGTIPVTFNVGPVGVVVQNVGNAASFEYGTVAPGSYAVLYGLNMAGTNVSVTFNGLAAQVVYKSATQLNLIVPSALSGQQAAAVIVTVDGLASNSFRVNLAANALGVFTPGIVNFTGGQVNTVTTPAARGDIVLVFLTGLASSGGGQVTVDIGDQTNLIPAYAGAQGTLPALAQVNITIPASLPASPASVPLKVCAPNTVGQRICSNAVSLYIK